MYELIADKRRGAVSVIFLVLVARDRTEQRASETFYRQDVLAPSTRLAAD